MPDMLLLLRLIRLLILTYATCAGSVGIYALVCSALHPHPDAAFFAIVALTVATGMTLTLPNEDRQSNRN
jgi:hypothetical protein